MNRESEIRTVRDIQAVAKRFFAVRKEWRELRELDPLRMPAIGRRMRDERGAEMRALAWVLGIDLDIADNTQPLPSGVAAVDKVTLTEVEGLNVWLLEVPAVNGPDWQGEYLGVPLTSDHMRQLIRALPDVAIRLWPLAGRGRVHVAVLPVPLPPASVLSLGEPELPPTA